MQDISKDLISKWKKLKKSGKSNNKSKNEKDESMKNSNGADHSKIDSDPNGEENYQKILKSLEQDTNIQVRKITKKNLFESLMNKDKTKTCNLLW